MTYPRSLGVYLLSDARLALSTSRFTSEKNDMSTSHRPVYIYISCVSFGAYVRTSRFAHMYIIYEQID